MAADNFDPGRRSVIKSVVTAAATVAAAGYVFQPASFFVHSRRKKVRFWHELGGIWLPPMMQTLDAFNRSQDEYEMEPLLMSDTEADSKLMLSTVGGDPPDVVLVWSQITSVWAQSGLIQPLDPFITAEEMKRFKDTAYPVVRKSGWYNGHLYGVVEGFDLWVCYYRPDHFRAAGLDPNRFPTTLEELVEVGEKLHKFDSGGEIDRIGFLPKDFQTVAPLFGGGFFDEKTGKLTLNTPENLQALKFLADTRKRFGFDKVVKFESGLASDDGASWSFMHDKYSIIADGEWRVEQLRQYAPEIEYRTATVPPPRGGKPKASFSMTNFLVMPKGAREPKGGWEFIRFWSGLKDPIKAAEFYPIFGWMPLSPLTATAPVYEAWLQKAPQYRTFLDVAASDNICITPPVPYQLYLMDQVQKTNDFVTRGTKTPEEAIVWLETEVSHELQRRKDLGYVD
jgi:multiple sugar transport system substrate-binding protein